MNTLPLLLCVILIVPIFGQGGGGFSDGDPNSPEVLTVATAALAKKNKSANGLKIISVKTQAVTGVRYEIKFTYAEGGTAVHEMTVVDNVDGSLDAVTGVRYIIKFTYAEGGTAVHEMTVVDNVDGSLDVDEFK
uniref:Cystatin domain-containing protein n=1 Tax=Steinernema glaseri TaxID=37863 RepID=A0A1I8AB44_9BILA